MVKLELAVVWPYELWTRKMSFVRRDAVRAVGALSDVRVTVTGPGWKDWHDDWPLQDNLDSHPTRYSAIWWYKPEDCVAPERRSIPAIVSYNEAWWSDWKAFLECKATRADAVICHHENDLDMFNPPIHVAEDYRPKVYHMPHAVDCRAFAEHCRPWTLREIPCVLTGVLSPEYYPLRCRIAELIRSGRIEGQVINHPGYRLADLEACDAQRERYVKTLGNSKVAIATASRFGYGLAKYVEAAAAGCVVAGDVPPDYEPTLGRHMVRLEQDTPDDEICELVSEAVRQRIVSRAVATQQTARRWHSMTRYAEGVRAILRWVT